MKETVPIAIVDYPGALKSSLAGFEEIFAMATLVCRQEKVAVEFSTRMVGADEAERHNGNANLNAGEFKAVIVPPAIETRFCLQPEGAISRWIIRQHAAGAVICSVCAGTFLLAETGLLHKRSATTHWGLADVFAQKYPDIMLDIDKIVINEGDLITAGGIMAWVDLAMELVTMFAGRKVMHCLARRLVIDSGAREQRYYKCFQPALNHGDKTILQAQNFIQKNLAQEISIAQLADRCCLSERMFLRRFVKATAFKPTSYLQHIRVQKACELIESSDETFACVALKVGYNDISAFRKVFAKITGLTPQDFKKRFVK